MKVKIDTSLRLSLNFVMTSRVPPPSRRHAPQVRNVMSRRHAFTLVELLVVMVIIALLMGLLFPAIQAARESARKTACRNNLYQIGRAVLNYESSATRFPSSWIPPNPYPATGTVSGWSAQAVLLPYLEQKATHSVIDYNQSYNLAPNVTTADGTSTKLSALRVPTYLCPSEVRDEVRLDGSGNPQHYPLNYAVNLGVWFVWNPANRQGGNGAFYPMSRLTAGDFADGQSYTMALAEVKAWNPYFRNGAGANPSMPVTPAEVCSLPVGTFHANSGHTEWVDGRAHQIGFTAQFVPNTRVMCESGGALYDVDWTNNQEGVTPSSGPVSTWAVITARSYHEGMVNVVMMDGSVRPIENDINLGVWQALSTRRGNEILPDSY